MTPKMASKTYSYLALGDSYTIGESVPVQDCFPMQAVKLLKESGLGFDDATIIAKTGWTTDELDAAIQKADLQTHYDFVSLLIGVNNQYRGRSVEEYSGQFEDLLRQSIAFTGDPEHVFVLSIPDWGVTPYAEGRDKAFISHKIDTFNIVNKNIAEKYKVHYIDITAGTREAAHDHSLITSDGLHPSGKEYARWAAQLSSGIEQALSVPSTDK
jgi:lysophospholipase L1-like esterase